MRQGRNRPILQVLFYKTQTGTEPVRQWLKSLNAEDRKIIGEDIKTVQFGWPLGMPLIRKMGPGIWEVRSDISQSIARVLFTVNEQTMVLLHSFIKKSQKTPLSDLRLAERRLFALRGEKS